MAFFRLLDVARADLDGIYDYVAARNQIAARDVTLRFFDVITMLAENPRAGAIHDGGPAGVRKFRCDSYLIFYRAAQEGIVVMRVLHGMRDISQIPLT